MKVYETSAVRNIALVSHQGSGKTSLAEALLFNSGATNRLGSVMEGTTVSDFDEDEINRQMSLYTSVVPVEMSGLKLNFLDTPGYTDFQGDVINSLKVSELALLLVDASSGVEVGTELYWEFADKFGLPRMIVVNKMDRDNIQLDAVHEAIRKSFDTRLAPIQYPVFVDDVFQGVVDLITMKYFRGEGAEDTYPPEVEDAVQAARLELMEKAAEANDALMEKYFDAGELTDEDMCQGIKLGLLDYSFVPVVYTAATANIGVRALANLLLELAPAPAGHEPFNAKDSAGAVVELSADDSGPLALYVFKTMVDPYVGQLTYFRVISGELKGDNRYQNHSVEEEERFGPLFVMQGKEQLQVDTLHAGDIGAVAKLTHTTTCDTIGVKGKAILVDIPEFPKPVYAVAVTPQTQADSAKMGPTLTRVADEDPTLFWRQEPATNETVMEGMGDVHIAVAIKRAASLGTNLDVHVPKVPYQETITKVGEASHRHKKQSGGAGQFGEVHLRLEPQPRGEGFEFANEVFGGAISQSFIPSIEKGIKQVMEQGVVAGYPFVDVRAVVTDGKEHPVDSKDIAFQIAGREAFKKAVQAAGPALLEPIVMLNVMIPESSMGDVIGDLSSRRGQVQGTEAVGNKYVVKVLIPLAEVQRYSNDLRSITGGRGVYTLDFSHYEVVPGNIAEEIIAAAQLEEEED